MGTKLIATFVSHYDALTFFGYVNGKGLTAKLAPVPRKISASCGTCVFFETASGLGEDIDFTYCEIESVYAEKDGKFCVIRS